MSDTLFSTKVIAKALGVFWIVDGLLQFQPKMFGPDFITAVLAPNLSDQPPFLHAIVACGIAAWSAHPVLFNIGAALLQVGIGILLLFPLASAACKTGLYISVVWGLLIWLGGEGAGLLLTGSATLYTGAPGAVLMYVLLALLLLNSKRADEKLYPKILAWLLIAGSLLQFQPIFWTAAGVQSMVIVATVTSDPIASNIVFLGVPLLVGLALLLKPNRITASITALLLFAMWWIGQDFGMLSTLFVGTSTDPNIAPLLALFLVPLYAGTTPKVFSIGGMRTP